MCYWTTLHVTGFATDQMVPRFRGVVQGWHRIKYVMSIEGSKAVQTHPPMNSQTGL